MIGWANGKTNTKGNGGNEEKLGSENKITMREYSMRSREGCGDVWGA